MMKTISFLLFLAVASGYEFDSNTGVNNYYFTTRDTSKLDHILTFIDHIAYHNDHEYYETVDNRGNTSVIWSIPPGQDIEFQYESEWFVASLQPGNSTHMARYSNDINKHRNLTITTKASIDVLDRFVLDANNYYKSLYAFDMSLSYSIYNSRYGYWNYIGDIERRDIDTIYIPDEDLGSLLESMEQFRNPAVAKRKKELGIPHKKIYLFEGVWGSGKTTLIRTLASKYDCGIYVIPITQDLNDKSIIESIPKISSDDAFLVFEDIDSLFENRHSTTQAGLTFSGLINALDGLFFRDRLEVFMTTNHVDRLDPALVRPGRVDYVLTFGYAKIDEITKMYKKFTRAGDNEVSRFRHEYQNQYTGVNMTVATLQQYFVQFIDNPTAAIDNLSNLELMRS